MKMENLLVIGAASLSLLTVGCENVGDKNESKKTEKKTEKTTTTTNTSSDRNTEK